jgi:hypoxia up-regulated 1
MRPFLKATRMCFLIISPFSTFFRKRFPYYNIVADAARKTVVFQTGDDRFSVEELVGQLLQKAKEFTQENTGQPISECVIVVPGYFGQSERTALLSAAALANLKVLQLINDYTSVALNYGIFRRKEINETAQYFLFYDMGAYKTSAAVVSYQLVKDKATREILPVVQVLGAAYDRTLGGLEISLRLRDHLAREFNAMKKTPTDVFTSPRALAKLLKEAGRVKTVLSANSEHYAQIEGLLDEKDFRVKVTREQLEEMCVDLFERAAKPVERALAAAGLTMDVMNQVILFGGGTRMPKIQESLKMTINDELGRNINADEAAALGAVYRGADLATGFKVKKFLIKDAVLFPIQVVFDREGDSGASKTVRRTLFGAMNAFPQKKIITFNKHTTDFKFDVNYAELDHLSGEEVKFIGSLNLTTVALSDVAQTLAANLAENIESKGIKAHFSIDESGIFTIADAEFVFEKTVKDDDDESTLSRLGSTISKLFSSETTTDEKVEEDQDSEKRDENTGGEDSSTTTTVPPTSDETTDKAKDNTTQTESGETSGEAANKTEPKPKILVVKKSLPSKITVLYTAPLLGDSFEASFKKVQAHNKVDQDRTRRENAMNSLESFVIETQRRLNEKEYIACTTAEEADAIRTACTEVSDWLYEDGMDSDADTFEKKLDTLNGLTNEVFARHWEHNERPEALKAFNSMINGSEGFLNSAYNLTKESNPDKDVFTLTEVEALGKAIAETVEWRNVEVAAQKKLKKNEPVRLTVKALTDKMAFLDREVKYLVNKIKAWKPKPKPEVKKEKKAKGKGKKSGNKTETADGDAEEKVIDGEQEETINPAPETTEENAETVDQATPKSEDPEPTATTQEPTTDTDAENHVEL